jgi:hypothetical protein
LQIINFAAFDSVLLFGANSRVYDAVAVRDSVLFVFKFDDIEGCFGDWESDRGSEFGPDSGVCVLWNGVFGGESDCAWEFSFWECLVDWGIDTDCFGFWVE